MQEKLDQLKTLVGEIADLYRVIGLLEWDQQCYMPPGGAEDRSHHLSSLYRLHHQKFTSPELGRLLEDLEGEVAGMDPDSDEFRLVQVTKDLFDKRTRVPADFIAEFARVAAIAHHVWEGARAENDFARFRPHLERIGYALICWLLRRTSTFTTRCWTSMSRA
jgi:carboxypeptidase Taq